MSGRTKFAVIVVVGLGGLTLYFNQNASVHTKRIVTVELIFVVAGLMIGGRAMDQASMCGNLPESEQLSVGDMISDFPVKDIEGEIYQFSKIRGSTTLVAFVQSAGHPLSWLNPNVVALGVKFHDRHITTVQISEPLKRCFPEGGCTAADRLPELNIMTLCDPARIAWKACREPRYDMAILVNARGEVVEMARLGDFETIDAKLI